MGRKVGCTLQVARMSRILVADFRFVPGQDINAAQGNAMTHGDDFYRELLDNLHDGVYFVDRDRRITFWNKGAERLSGFSAAEVVGRRCSDNILTHTWMRRRASYVRGHAHWRRPLRTAAHANRTSSCITRRATECPCPCV